MQRDYRKPFDPRALTYWEHTCLACGKQWWSMSSSPPACLHCGHPWPRFTSRMVKADGQETQ